MNHPGNGPAEAALTADYNAEMLEHIERYPRVRDISIFVGERYITGFAPNRFDRQATWTTLGYAPDELVCIATVGGSGVGSTLLHTVMEAHRLAREMLPTLRMVVVAGPRPPTDLLGETPPSVEVLGFVPDLQRHLAACDLAIIQGGLTTAMELTALRRPFVYVPLGRHFEQQRHVPHRLRRYQAGRRLDHVNLDAPGLATAITEEIGREVDYLPVATDGAARAARIIAELL